jgi:hypothetical protein
VVHIELRRWADLLLIAPLSANTLAKAAGGLCDNLLTCVVRAWDFRRPLLVGTAPAACQRPPGPAPRDGQGGARGWRGWGGGYPPAS